eukprot:6480855-Amphidinium_carterae.1
MGTACLDGGSAIFSLTFPEANPKAHAEGTFRERHELPQDKSNMTWCEVGRKAVPVLLREVAGALRIPHPPNP